MNKLFSSSVLAKSVKEDVWLSPNPAHLSAFEFDIERLVRLLRKGSLDELPPVDKLVANLAKSLISLQAEDLLGNEESRFHSFSALGTERATARLLSHLWKSTKSLLTMEGSMVGQEWQSVCDTDFRAAKSDVATFKLSDLLLPSSRLLGGCLSLLVAWAKRLPKKKVRQGRFLKQLKTLRLSLPALESELSKHLPRVSAPDDFASAFKANQPVEVGDAKERMSSFIVEASGNLRILESIVAQTESPSSERSVVTKGITLQSLQEVRQEVSARAACTTSF